MQKLNKNDKTVIATFAMQDSWVKLIEKMAREQKKRKSEIYREAIRNHLKIKDLAK